MKITKAGRNFNEMVFRTSCSICGTYFEFEGHEGTMAFTKSKNGTLEGAMSIQCPGCTAPQLVNVDRGQIPLKRAEAS